MPSGQDSEWDCLACRAGKQHSGVSAAERMTETLLGGLLGIRVRACLSRPQQLGLVSRVRLKPTVKVEFKSSDQRAF